MGYNPETSYETRHQEIFVTPDEEYTEFIMEHFLPAEEHSGENAARIFSWLKSHADADGHLLEISDAGYGTILWNITEKDERPDYHAWEQEV